jgi:hypothetical protein
MTQIGIHDYEKFPPRRTCSSDYGPGQAQIGIVACQQTKGKLCRRTPHLIAGPIGRAIIDKDDLHWLQTARHDRPTNGSTFSASFRVGTMIEASGARFFVQSKFRP